MTELAGQLERVKHKWYEISILLGVSATDLDNLLAMDGISQDQRFRKAIEIWVTTVNPSWQMLVDAVGHAAGGDKPAHARKVLEYAKTKGKT